MHAPQFDFPFVSLDFPGRTALMAGEVAERLGISPDHVRDLVEEGQLIAVDVKSGNVTRSTLRIPVESYRDFIIRNLTGPVRVHFLSQLPEPTKRELHTELCRLLGVSTAA